MKKAYFFVVLTAFLFGTMEVACKAAGNQLDPFQLTFLRFAIGGLILLPFAAAELKQNRIKLTAKDILILAGVGALGIPLSMVFFQLGVMNSNAATASVLICINPFFTMVFAHFFTEEKLNRNKFIVLAIGLAGLIFMIKPWNIQEGNTVIGIVYMLLAAVFFGAYTVAGKVSVQKMGIMAQTSENVRFWKIVVGIYRQNYGSVQGKRKMVSSFSCLPRGQNDTGFRRSAGQKREGASQTQQMRISKRNESATCESRVETKALHANPEAKRKRRTQCDAKEGAPALR